MKTIPVTGAFEGTTGTRKLNTHFHSAGAQHQRRKMWDAIPLSDSFGPQRLRRAIRYHTVVMPISAFKKAAFAKTANARFELTAVSWQLSAQSLTAVGLQTIETAEMKS